MIDSSSTVELADGRALGYGDAGDPDGFPIVYLHGSIGCRTIPTQWDREARAAGVRLITPERPGYGLSDFQPGRRLLDWPSDLSTLCDRLEIGSFALAGFSGGGPFALATAARLPDRIVAVASVSGLAPLDREGAFDGFRDVERELYDAATSPVALQSAVDEWARELVEEPEKRIARYRIPAYLGDDEDDVCRYMFEVAPSESWRNGPAGVAYELWLYKQPWEFLLDDVRVPVDIWHGDEDDMLPYHHAQYLLDHLPTTSLRRWPDGDHFSGVVRLGDVIGSLSATARAAQGGG